jgi:hypothetical protein
VTQGQVSDGVDATMDAMEPTRSDPARDGALVETRAMQLPNRNHPILPRSDPRDGAFLSHTESKAPATRSLP